MPHETTVAPLSTQNSSFLSKEGFLKELAEQGLPLSEKQIDFRRKSGNINERNIPSEIHFSRVKGFGQRLMISKDEAVHYIERLKRQSVSITYKDVKSVVEAYDAVMQKPARAAMRRNRSFTGKIEDEIKGKLVEWGLAKYADGKTGLKLLIDFALITDKTRKRDEGDFVRCQVGHQEKAIPDELKLSVKSTAGNLLAVPEVETTWEGSWFILSKLHIDDRFLYKAIKAGLGLGKLDLDEKLGWFEIRGFISKKEFTNEAIGFKGVNLPGVFAMDNDFGRDNFIMLPTQLNQSPDDFIRLLEKIKSAVS